MHDEQDRTSSFGKWLRRQRKARDITQAELAQRVGCTRDTIKRIEMEVRRPSKQLAARIAMVLEIPPEEREAMIQAARGKWAIDRLPFPTQPVGTGAAPTGAEPPHETAAGPAPQRHQLRTPLPDFVGQQAALRTLLEAMRQATQGGTVAAISGVRGMGGIGKTELAYLVANHMCEAFPDAQIVVNLRGMSDAPLPPEQALRQVIHAFTPNAKLPDDLAALQTHYHSVLHHQRALILADDARDVAQVRALLPPAGCALLITSRVRFTLPGMASIDLEVLDEAEAVTLLRGLCARLNMVEARRLARACGGLPLALSVCGSLLHNDPALAVVTYLQQLTDARQRLPSLRDPHDAQSDVAATLALSYAQLDAEGQRVFRQLGVLASDFAAELAEAVVERPSHGTIRETLHTLLRRNLVIYHATQSRWRLHDLLRDLARHQLEVAQEWEGTMWRYARAAVQLAEATQNQYLEGGGSTLAALARFDAERAHIDAGCRWAVAQAGTPDGDQLLLDAALATISIGSLRFNARHERLPLWNHALAAAQRLGDRHAEGQVLNRLGIATAEVGAAQQAAPHYERAVVIARELGDQRLEAASLGNLGAAYVDLGEARRAITCLEPAAAIFHSLGNQRCEGIALINLGSAYTVLGKTRRAISYYEHYLTIMRTCGDRRREGTALHSLGEAHRDLGDAQRAREYCEQAIAIFHALGDQRRKGIALGTLGRTWADLGDTRRAITCCEDARTILHAIEDRRQEGYALSSLAYALARQEDLAQATTSLEQAIACLREVGDRHGEAICRWMLGMVLVQQGELERALPLLWATIAYEQEIGHAKASEHAALLARLERGKALPAPADA